MKNKPIILIVTLVLILVGVSAKADQVFLFTDDLSTQFDIDQSQTSAKFGLGRFSTADDSVSSAVVSKIIANPYKAIISARLDVSVSMPSNTRIIYYLSNNNGFRWTQVSPEFTYGFDLAGNELRWKAVIARESPVIASAYVDSVNITYTVSDVVAPSPYSNQILNKNSTSLSSVLYGGGGDLQLFVCDALSSIGLGCGAPQKVSTPIYSQPNSQSSTIVSQNTPQESAKKQADNPSYLQASIANVTVKRTASNDEVILVKTPANKDIRPTLGLSTSDAIFEIIKGQKHFIPTTDIFFDYGFNLSAVQNVTLKDLELFPRAKLVNIYKDKKRNYYITEGYMIRLIPNKHVFESYGDREEDIITISKKEFNFYPRNQFVFLENPLSADVFQIVNDGSKRYIVPQVMKRLRMNLEQIAPINQVQLDAYQNNLPIIY